MGDGRRSLKAVAALAALAVAVAATPAVAARDGAPGRATTVGAAELARPFAMDLYARGDFVSQTNLVQCVGASMQMMLNMIGPSDDRTAARQLGLFDLARALADRSPSPIAKRPGATAAGWARGLTASGGGTYVVRSTATRAEAVALAAAAIERTGRPVGLLMWVGAHAWVMSGFEATGDPATDPAARVTAVRVLDPLYSRAVGEPWGPGPGPDARLTVDQLARAFVPYRPHGRTVALRGRFVLVLPVDASLVSRTGPLAF